MHTGQVIRWPLLPPQTHPCKIGRGGCHPLQKRLRFPYQFPSRRLLVTLHQQEPGRINVRSIEKQSFHLFSDNPASSEGKSNSSLAMPKAIISSLKILGAAGADRVQQSGGKGSELAHRHSTGWSRPCLHPLGCESRCVHSW